MSLSAVVYDAEIRCAIPPGERWERQRGLEYCKGWGDHAGMGISVVAAYDLMTGMTSVYMRDNLHHFQNLVDSREHVIGFNSQTFDDKLLGEHGLTVATTYDVFREIKAAVGRLPKQERGDGQKPSYSLESMCVANLGVGKTDTGANAPLLWQRGRIGELITYCLADVQVTAALFARRDALRDPNTGGTLCLRPL